jgi:hypothetical protein
MVHSKALRITLPGKNEFARQHDSRGFFQSGFGQLGRLPQAAKAEPDVSRNGTDEAVPSQNFFFEKILIVTDTLRKDGGFRFAVERF